MTPKRALLIANRACRRGATDLTGVVERLRERGIETHVVYPDNAAQSSREIRAAVDVCDRVIMAGGDGTLHSSLPALLEARLPLGILPLGTANDFARSLGLPRGLEAAAEVIADGFCEVADVSTVNGVHFLNGVSIGLGVAVTRRLSGELKERWGVLSYGRALIEALVEPRAFRVRLDCDGKTETVRSLQVTIGNARYYGGGMAVAEDATATDRRLHLYSIEPQGFWSLVRLLPALRRGAYDELAGVLVREARRLRVETTRPMRITADGEPCGCTPATLEIMPGALPVFVPRN